MMLKAIFFDLWDTLFYDDVEIKPIEEFANRLGETLKDYSYVKIFERSFMLKKDKDYKIPTLRILKEMDIEPKEKLVDKLLAILCKIGPKQKPYPEVFGELEKLHKKYKLALISNCSYPIYLKLTSRYDLKKYFDVILISAEIGIIKPDPRIFQLALDKLKVKKEEALMVGDSISDDFNATRNFGMKSVLIDRTNRHPEIKQRITSLSELNKFL